MAEEKTSEKEEKKETSPKVSVEKPVKKEEKPKEVKVPEKFKKLVEEIEKMPVVELAELVKILEKKFGVSATAPVAVQAAAGAGPAQGQGVEAATEEKSVFNIELTGVGEKKIDVIKAVRDVMGKGLKESKDLVDAAEKEAQMIRENVKKEEAEEIKKKFEAAGAKVELK